MRTGVVISLHIGGLGNKIFNYGDPVTERNFPPGNFEKLVEVGHIKADEEKQKVAEKVKEETKQDVRKITSSK